MATTSDSRSKAENYHCFRDLCCDRQDQKKIASVLKYFPIGLLALSVVASGVLLVLRFAVTPSFRAYVEDARLNIFNLANKSGSAMAYNISISVALTVRNPNGAMDITYTRPFVAIFLFDDRRLYNVTVVDQGHKHRPLRREVHLLHTGGEVPYVLDTAAAGEFRKQNASGVISVEMRLSGEITLGIGNTRGLELSCPLRLQRPPTGQDVVVFHQVDCQPDRPKKIVF